MKLGLLGNAFYNQDPRGLITGFATASNDLMESFLRYSTAEEISCLYEPGQYHHARLNDLQHRLENGNRIRMISEYELLFHGIQSMLDIDVLHSTKEDPIPLLGLRESMQKPIPITFTIHSLADQHLLLDTFYPLLLLPFREYDAVICSSKACASAMASILDRCRTTLSKSLGYDFSGRKSIQIRTIPLGIDTQRFHPIDKQISRTHLGLSEDGFYILWFGRFSDLYKADLLPLIRIFSNLLEKNVGKKLFLVLAGSSDDNGGYLNLLKAEAQKFGIEKHIVFLRNEQVRNRAELYSACDVFTSPVDNVQETFGLTPIEAMACGTPQVVSDWDGYRDTVVDGVTGYLIPTYWCDCMDDVAAADYLPLSPSHRHILQRHLAVRSVALDPEIYESKLQYLIDNPDIVKQMSTNSVKYARTHFSTKNVVHNTEELWRELMLMACESSSVFSGSHIPMINYCKDFSSYPSGFILDTDDFEISERGRPIDLSEFHQYRQFQDYVEESLVVSLAINYLKNGAGNIHDFSATFPEYSMPQIRRSFMFLLKNGIIHRA